MADLLTRLQEMYASGKRLSTSKKYAKLYNQYQASGGNTGLISGGVGYSSADALAKEQEAKTADFLNRYTSAIQAQPTIQDIYDRIYGELGIGAARDLSTGLTQQALDIEGRLQNLPEQITGETRGFDVNAAQRAKIEEQRTSKMGADLTQMARAAERAGVRTTALGQEAMTRLGLEAGQLEKELAPFQTEAELLNDNLARKLSMYTTERQGQLDTLLEKLRIQGNLDATEMKLAADLALQEDKYKREKDYLTFSQQYKTPSSVGTVDGW